MNKQDIERNKIYLQQLIGNIIFDKKEYKITVEYIEADISPYYCFKVFDKKNQIAIANLQNWESHTVCTTEQIDILGNLKKELYDQVKRKNNFDNNNILVFVNGVLLQNDQYEIAYSLSKIIFNTSLNSQAQSTKSSVIIVKNGIKIYEQKITQQNISKINLYSGEISE